MGKPTSGSFETGPSGGVVYQYTNDGDTSVQPEYASVSAPSKVLCTVSIDGTITDRVWVDSSHSWWTAAGGRLLRYPLKVGQTLKVALSGQGAFRIDWYE